jgi:hypothetical protein
MGAWWFAACWAAEEETDGFIPDEETERFDPDKILIPWLIKAGYFEEATVGGERGYILHDWLDIQESKAKLDAGRAADAAQKRKARAAKATNAVPPDSPPDGDGPGGGRPADVPPGVPGGHVNGHPTDVPLGLPLGLPDGVDATSTLEDIDIDLELTTSPLRGVAAAPRTARERAGPEFEEFYAAYPRKVEPEDAARAFLKVKKLISHRDLMAATRRFATEMAGREKRHIRYPASWLNKGGYASDPEPDRARASASGLLDY